MYNTHVAVQINNLWSGSCTLVVRNVRTHFFTMCIVIYNGIQRHNARRRHDRKKWRSHLKSKSNNIVYGAYILYSTRAHTHIHTQYIDWLPKYLQGAGLYKL